jgi:hypothetical protein
MQPSIDKVHPPICRITAHFYCVHAVIKTNSELKITNLVAGLNPRPLSHEPFSLALVCLKIFR